MATAAPRKPDPLFNIPNQLTFSRLILSVILFILIAYSAWIWCLIVFAIAAFTDWADGFVARLQGVSSSLGRVLDPLVDKVLICGTFIFLIPYGSAPDAGWLTPWMVVVVVSREFLITGLRSYLESIGVSFGADWLGKLKMGLQSAAVIAIFIAEYFPLPWLGWCRIVLVYAMVIATILSGVQYIVRGAMILGATAKSSS